MADIGKRKFIQLATWSVVATASGLLMGCEESSSDSGQKERDAAPPNGSKPLTLVSDRGQTGPSSMVPLNVGFIYMGPVDDAGWTYAHDKGRQHIEKVFGDRIKTSYVESVDDRSDSERVIRSMVDDGKQLIFGTSLGYMDAMVRVASDHPDVYFEHCTGFKTAANLRIYDHRIYEAAYQAGIIAAYMSKSKILGFVGSFPIPEVLRNVNGFILGAHSVDPDIKVKLLWTKSWNAATKEVEMAETLLRDGADVLLQNTDSTAVLQAAAASEHYGFGWGSDMAQYAPEAHLGSCALNWGIYYEKAVNDVLNKNWKSEVNRWGTKEGLVEFIKLSENVPSDAKQRVLEIQEALKSGEYAIFKGPIKDNAGNEKLAEGLVADDNWNNKVDFLIEGVDGVIS